MDEAFLHDLIRLVSLTGLLAFHVLVILYGVEGERRGRRTAIAHLAAFDWALIVGVTAGRSVASEGTAFWSPHTAAWGFLGVLLLFLPAWLLFYRKEDGKLQKLVEGQSTLIDLRPQIRPRTVQALTRDGIPVKVPMTAVFHDCYSHFCRV